MTDKIRVAVVDDHPLYRDGVVFGLEFEPDIEVVAQGESAEDAIQIARDVAPHILLLDMNMPGGGINAAAKIAQRSPGTKTLMLTVVDDEEEVRNALQRGARGYLLKGASSSELVQAIRLVNKGQNYVSPSFAMRLLTGQGNGESNTSRPPKRFPELSAREEEILLLIVQGMSNRLIGNEVGLSEKTVKGYVTRIMEKLHVQNRVEAALVATDRMAEQQDR
ncbi:response regulator [Microvirga aerophila]|uniref:DNA-binding response regulator n=1 Tax=Microvirga aerophila TaxID=670291 RepID=A0A512C1P1_9HYPH|nr:response regulator transcription factor [Microvirga aerophila]GEO18138.1 DNA-binding response regulator [Microvirga aerophila]